MGRPDFKSGRGREPVLGGFNSLFFRHVQASDRIDDAARTGAHRHRARGRRARSRVCAQGIRDATRAGRAAHLITRDLETPYSGMLPGVVAGLYGREQAQIDLVRLAAATGTRLIHAETNGLDRGHKRVQLADRAPIAYDVMSIDVGITPDLASIVGAVEHANRGQADGSFLSKFELCGALQLPDGPRRIAVIGGGAGGVELLLSVGRAARVATPRPAAQIFVCNGHGGRDPRNHNVECVAPFGVIFAQRGIETHEQRTVRALTPITVESTTARDRSRSRASDDRCSGPRWFRDTDLALELAAFSPSGRPSIDVNDSDVFAAGDCAALVETPREPRPACSRSAPGRRWRKTCAGMSVANHSSHGTRSAGIWHLSQRVNAMRSPRAVHSRREGAWVWRWKDWIDRRWMRRYQDVDRMVTRMRRSTALIYANGPQRRDALRWLRREDRAAALCRVCSRGSARTCGKHHRRARCTR